MPIPVFEIARQAIKILRPHPVFSDQKKDALYGAIVEGLLEALSGEAIRLAEDFGGADVPEYSAHLEKLHTDIAGHLKANAVSQSKNLFPVLVKQAVQDAFFIWKTQANAFLKSPAFTKQCTIGGWEAFRANGIMKLRDAMISEEIIQKLPRDKRAIKEKIVQFLKENTGSVQHNSNDDAKYDNEQKQQQTTFACLLQRNVIDEAEAKVIVAALIKEVVQFEQAGEGTFVICKKLGKEAAIGLKEKWAVRNIGWNLGKTLPGEGFKLDPQNNNHSLGVQVFKKGKQMLRIDRSKGIFLVSGKEAAQCLANEIVKSFPKGVQLKITGNGNDNKHTVKEILTNTYSAKGIKLVVVQNSDGNFVLSPSRTGKTVKPKNTHAAMMMGAMGGTDLYSEAYTPFESSAPFTQSA